MSTGKNRSTMRARGAYQIIQTHTAILAKLRDEQPTRASDINNPSWSVLQYNEIIQPTEKILESVDGSTQEYYLWQITPRYQDLVDRILDGQVHLPCGEGHTGWRTVEAGERYECTECGAEYGREVIEQLEARR